MNIARDLINFVKFSFLKDGEVFIDCITNRVFLRISKDYEEKLLPHNFNAVNLADGSMKFFDEEEYVILPKSARAQIK